MIYLKLFWSFFQIGLFSIGGGYASLPLIQNQVVEINKWITMTEFANLITISGMTPGSIAVNSSAFVGTQIAGLPGALVAAFGCILPSSIIVLTLAYFYYKYKNLTIIQGVLSGLRPAIVALIASAGLSILILAFWGNKGITFHLADVNYIAVGLFTLSLLVLRKFKTNPIYVMMGSGLVGMVIYLVI